MEPRLFRFASDKPKNLEEKNITHFGITDFEAVRKLQIEHNGFFIDKSDFIKEVIDNRNVFVQLILRPQGFGKSFNLSMLQCFFDRRKQNSKELFSDLKIWKADENYRRLLGKFPVILINFESVTGATFEEMYQNFKKLVMKLFEEFEPDLREYLSRDKVLQQMYEMIRRGEGDGTITKYALQRLTRYLYHAHHRRVIVLIDAFEKPVEQGYLHGFHQKAQDLIHGCMHVLLKDSSDIQQAIITASSRASRESIFGGLHLPQNTFLDHCFNRSFGFLETEIQATLVEMKIFNSQDQKENKEQESKIDDVIKLLTKTCGGYHTKGVEMLNPALVINKLKEQFKSAPLPTMTRSVNEITENPLLIKLLTSHLEVKNTICETLLKNQLISKKIDFYTILTDIEINPERAILSILVLKGYLVALTQFRREESYSDIYPLMIPNDEFREAFEKISERISEKNNEKKCCLIM